MAQTILLIEDDVDQSTPLIQMLQYRGYKVIQAFNGMDGVAQATQNTPDLVIVDLLLVEKGDEFDGYQVIGALRRNPKTAKIAILAWTSHYVANKDQIRALRVGADDFVTKDIEFGVFEARIEALLKRTRG